MEISIIKRTMITLWKVCLALYDNLLTKKVNLINFCSFCFRTFYRKKIFDILAYFTGIRSLRSTRKITCKIAKFCNFEIIQANSEFLMNALYNDI